jgi:hypothetical protein
MFKSHEVEDGLSTIFGINFHASSCFSLTSEEGLQQKQLWTIFSSFKKKMNNQSLMTIYRLCKQNQ